jgi:hypothetical protein
MSKKSIKDQQKQLPPLKEQQEKLEEDLDYETLKTSYDRKPAKKSVG